MGTFIELYDSVKKDELILINGGICQFHIRRDKQLTIHVIISTRLGAGSQMLEKLIKIGKKERAICLFAKCPSNLLSNNWYEKKGFKKIDTEILKSGTKVNSWQYILREPLIKKFM